MLDKYNDIINEEISDIDKVLKPDGTINFNSFDIKDSLNPDIFNNDELKPKIKKALLKILDSIIDDSVLLKKKDIKDAVIVGSIVSFHYSSYSDIDFHILIDMEKLNDDTELVKSFLDDERRLWNIYHHVEIEGYEVEIYFQDINEKNVSNGCYSVLNDKWVKYPNKETYTIDKEKLSKKAINLIENIEILKDSDTPDLKYAQKLWDKVIKGRKEDIAKNGEFSEGNILFKILRRTGHIEILKNIIDSQKDKELSIEESKNIDNIKKKINSKTNMKLNIKKFNNSLMESIRDYCATNNTKEISKHTIMHIVESCLEDECDEITEDKEELAVIHITATGKNKAECSQNAYEKLKKYLHDMKMEKPKIAAMKYTEVKEEDGIMNIKLEAQIEGITGDDIYIDEHDELKECIKKTIKECDKVQNEEEILENDLEDTKSIVTDKKKYGSEKDTESLVEKYVALANKYFGECSNDFYAKASYSGYDTKIKYTIRTPKMFLFGELPLPSSEDTDILCKVDTRIGKQNPTYEYLNDLLQNANYRISSEMFNQVFKEVFREYKYENDAECIDKGKDILLTIYNYVQYYKK